VSGLDRANAALVLAAISHANGSHARPEYLPSLSAKGVQTINLSSPRIDLDSLFPRPEP